MARLWRGQVFVRQNLRIKWIVIAEVFSLKALAIDFVFLREFVALRRVEGVEFSDRLCGEHFSVDEKKDAANKLRFQKTINLRDSQICFSRSCRHCDHHVMFVAK